MDDIKVPPSIPVESKIDYCKQINIVYNIQKTDIYFKINKQKMGPITSSQNDFSVVIPNQPHMKFVVLFV